MDTTERAIVGAIEAARQKIIEAGRDIYDHGEMGFKEYRTAAKVSDFLEGLGIPCETGLAVTGVKGYLRPPKKGECIVALVGEMDALPIPEHPHANPETGGAHCCGHNAQIAGLLGAAIALTRPEVQKTLGGNVAFMAVPSEEYVDTSFKNGLIRKGVIAFGGGKSELIRIGAFDDIAVVVGHHIAPGAPGYLVANGSTNGFVNKVVRFHGRAAHAAGNPEQGLDALNAAMLALHGVDLQRETFRDQDSVRIHSFLPRAGEAINVVAAVAEIESSVRAKTLEATLDAGAKYDRAMRAGALALGCGVEITTVPGYLPTIPLEDPSLMTGVLLDLAKEAQSAGRDYTVGCRGADYHESGSTDFGDVSNLLPLYQFRTGGYEGELHNAGIRVVDEQLAYVETAKAFALMAYRLLKDQAAAGKRVAACFHPQMTKEQYVAYMSRMNRHETFQTADDKEENDGN